MHPLRSGKVEYKMSDFNTAVKKTLVHEGGFQKNPNDRANWTGGEVGVGELVGTKYGITTLDMPGVDIENLDEPTATEFYRERYWKQGYSQINDQSVADKLFDLGVLFGVEVAVAVMQQTLSADELITVDGKFGDETLNVINLVDPVSLLKSYEANMTTHAFNVATKNPAEREFLRGWCSRIGCSDSTPCEKHQ